MMFKFNQIKSCLKSSNIYFHFSTKSKLFANMVDVVVFGSANVDFITYVPHLPLPGETLHATKFETCFGGKGANQCVAAAKLGAATALVAKLGKDTNGNDYLSYLRNLQVNVNNIDQMEGQSSGVAQISVAEGGENHIIIVAGANAMLNATDVEHAGKLFDNSKILLCQLETPVLATEAALRAFRGISILNASPWHSDMPHELIGLASIICVNAIEAAQLTGKSEINTLLDAKAAAEHLIEMGAKKVIITLGAKGVVCKTKHSKDGCLHVPAEQVSQVVDTTGAGDAFLGGLAFYLSKFPDVPVQYHIKAANEISAYSIQYRGTQPSYPDSSKAKLNIDQNVKFIQI